MKTQKHPAVVLLLLLLILLAIAVISIGAGAIYIPPLDVISALFTESSQYHFIINEYRMPRIIIGILAGAGLAAAGAILQGVVRNPLASPDVIGVTKGAGLAAMIVILIFPASPIYVLPFSAFCGAAFIAILLVTFIYKKNARSSSLALVGIAIGAVCEAGMQYLMIKFPGDTNAALIWLTGSLYGRDWSQIQILVAAFIILLPLLFVFSRKLNLLSFSDEVAEGWGENAKRLRFSLLFLSVALAGACVAVVGSIGFIGLIAPHISRKIIGSKYEYMIPASCFIGSILLLSADSLGRGVMPPAEIPAGIVTAIIGAPYFLYLLRTESKKRKKG
ncbi:iron chelate uptake ABC transporter family permease subunit [Bacillus gobiensis]|uniref:FecCD family ABC transporter permease n=1 Tax=Bacillus gobiensis TaxID=1441095 RepID=UPI003D1B6909